MGNAAIKRRQRRAAERETARERALEARLAEVLEECDRRQRMILDLEERVEAADSAYESAERELVETRNRAHALDCRVADLKAELELKRATIEALEANSRKLGAVEHVCRRYGYADGEAVSDWLEQVLADAEALGNAKLRRRLQERTRERDEARTRAARLEKATVC